VLRKIADGADDVALIFEDDIDMEWDLERRLRYLWSFLPDNWDMVLIGISHLCLLVTSMPNLTVIIQAIVFPMKA
jgi:GR25 family glycosyltransferase involved in LPS biosynthesis